MTFSFEIAIRPVTKKNHGQIVFVPVKGSSKKRPIMLPSEDYREFDEAAQRVLFHVRQRLSESIDVPVNCCAVFYRDANRGDLVNYLQALADTLEKAGIVTNDRLIVGWDGSRMDKDQSRPRIEVTLTTLAEMQESLPI